MSGLNLPSWKNLNLGNAMKADAIIAIAFTARQADIKVGFMPTSFCVVRYNATHGYAEEFIL
jgi:hypothetical protein